MTSCSIRYIDAAVYVSSPFKRLTGWPNGYYLTATINSIQLLVIFKRAVSD